MRFADLSKLTQLTALLVVPPRQDKTMEYITRLTRLRALELRYKNNGAAVMQELNLERLTGLQQLVVGCDAVRWVPRLRQLASLTRLELSGLRSSHISAVADFAELTSLNCLRLLEYNECGYLVVPEAEFPSLSKLTALTELEWRCQHLKGLARLTALQKLTLASAFHGGGGAEHGLSLLAELRELVLWPGEPAWKKLELPALTALTKLTRLHVLGRLLR